MITATQHKMIPGLKVTPLYNFLVAHLRFHRKHLESGMLREPGVVFFYDPVDDRLYMPVDPDFVVKHFQAEGTMRRLAIQLTLCGLMKAYLTKRCYEAILPLCSRSV